MSDPWFDPNTFGAWYGGIVGSGTGIVGGGLGCLIAVLAPRGRGRHGVMGAMFVLVVLGAAQVVFGVAALLCKQPFGIWYPPSLCGFITVSVIGGNIPLVRRRYAESPTSGGGDHPKEESL